MAIGINWKEIWATPTVWKAIWTQSAPAPTPTPSPSPPTPTGGFFFGFDRHQYLRNKARREREELEREALAIEDEVTREIAVLLREQEDRDAERADLARIQALADEFAGHAMAEGASRRAAAAILKAHEERTLNSLRQMQREIERMLEEEEVAVMVILNN